MSAEPDSAALGEQHPTYPVFTGDGLAFAVELVILGLSAPVLLFARQFPAWAVLGAIALLASAWIWRRVRLGYFFTATPLDSAMALLFCVLLPVSIWAAPPVLREQISLPRGLVMIWNLCLFWTIVTYASRKYEFVLVSLGGCALAAVAIAAVALLGTQWSYTFPGSEALLGRLPAPLRGAFAGAEAGFHPNQVAGTLLYVFPLLLAVSVSYVGKGSRIDAKMAWLPWVIVPATMVTGAITVLAQSRAALLGLLVAVVFMALVGLGWGRIVLVVLAVAILVGVPFAGEQTLDLLSDAPPVEALGGAASVENFRRILWAQALAAASDFSLTGMGLGTFRELVRVLYPLDIAPAYDVAHAHNFFLQTAVDFGVAGLVAVMAMYFVAVVQLIYLWTRPAETGTLPVGAARVWATGLAGSLLAQTIYSQLDAVSMGAKTSFMLWFLLALIMGLVNLAAGLGGESGMPAPAALAGRGKLARQ